MLQRSPGIVPVNARTVVDTARIDRNNRGERVIVVAINGREGATVELGQKYCLLTGQYKAFLLLTDFFGAETLDLECSKETVKQLQMSCNAEHIPTGIC